MSAYATIMTGSQFFFFVSLFFTTTLSVLPLESLLAFCLLCHYSLLHLVCYIS